MMLTKIVKMSAHKLLCKWNLNKFLLYSVRFPVARERSVIRFVLITLVT